MPWTIKDVPSHKKGLSNRESKKWIAIANAVLDKTGDEVFAIKTANAKTTVSESSYGGLDDTGYMNPLVKLEQELKDVLTDVKKFARTVKEGYKESYPTFAKVMKSIEDAYNTIQRENEANVNALVGQAESKNDGSIAKLHSLLVGK